MVGTVVLLVTLILVCTFGFVLIYHKLDKQKNPDINLTVNVPKSNSEVRYYDSIQQNPLHPLNQGLVDNDFFKTNPMDYIAKTPTKAHITWHDSPPAEDPGSSIT